MGRHFGPWRLTAQFVVWLTVFACLFLSSCQSSPYKEQPESSETANTLGQKADQQELKEPESEEPIALSPAEKAREDLQGRFLRQADRALRAGRLTEPAHDNAYDRFQSVLMLDPNNQLARAGVQAVLLNYADRIRSALKKGRRGLARSLLRSAETYFPANPLLMDLKREIANMQQQEEELLLKNEPAVGDRVEFPLPAGALSRRSSTVSDYLARIAQRLRQTDETVLIYARTDTEGRWIYRQLKKAVPGYRVRGDIKISGQAKITVLPPLQ